MSKAGRRSARERLREERRQEVERERRQRRRLVVLTPIAVIVLVVAAGVAVQALRSRANEFAGTLPPATVLDDGSVRLAAEDTTENAPVVEVYEDFQCPACREFERINGGTLQNLAADGEAVVIYHPVAIIDQRSVRAGSAAQCAAEAGKFMDYHDVLFENQPPERGGKGFTAADLTGYGAQAGLDGDEFAECVESNRYRQELLQRTRQISAAYQRQTGRGFGTPTVYVNGHPLDPQVLYSVDAFTDAVDNAPAPNRTSSVTSNPTLPPEAKS